MNDFKNRVFGCVIVKAVNANYNADFTHQPRTLPDGTVYATDIETESLSFSYCIIGVYNTPSAMTPTILAPSESWVLGTYPTSFQTANGGT